jgi:hypothetical protein
MRSPERPADLVSDCSSITACSSISDIAFAISLCTVVGSGAGKASASHVAVGCVVGSYDMMSACSM